MVGAIQTDHSTVPNQTLSARPPDYVELLEYPSRIIVAGSRGWDDPTVFRRVLNPYLTQVHKSQHIAFISGRASKGADRWIYEWCQSTPFRCFEYRARWDDLGRRAGHVRNHDMALDATHVLVFWDEHSKGSLNMIQTALRLQLQVHVYTITYGLRHIQSLDELKQ